MITPIKKENATDQIYMQLLDMIFTGSWSAGSKIPSEAELSKQFGVSRVPVREALQRLNAMGIITSQQGRGAFVNAAPSSDILSVYLAMLGNKDFELKACWWNPTVPNIWQPMARRIFFRISSNTVPTPTDPITMNHAFSSWTSISTIRLYPASTTPSSA